MRAYERIPQFQAWGKGERRVWAEGDTVMEKKEAWKRAESMKRKVKVGEDLRNGKVEEGLATLTLQSCCQNWVPQADNLELTLQIWGLAFQHGRRTCRLK